ncbi:MAG TPA: hypothetical protein PLZ51_13615, partial [Aggregatilineales bacterium]|nr:hypothetical protein [Aggregatilineales bacterium]
PNLRQDLIAMLMVTSAQLDPIYQSHVWTHVPEGNRVTLPVEFMTGLNYDEYTFLEDDRWDRY